VIAAREQVAALRTSLAAEATRVVAQHRADRDAAQATLAELEKQYEQIRGEATSRAPASLALDRERETLASLRHSADVIGDRLIALEAQLKDPNARLLTQAEPPLAPDFPPKLYFGVGGAVFAGLLAATAIVVGFFVSRMSPSAGLQAYWFGTDLIGCLPTFKRRATSRTRVLEALRGGSAVKDQPGVVAFQGIAFGLEEIIRRDAIRVLAVTSGNSGEGKSSVTVGIAVALASGGMRILILDCDLRKPSIEGILDGGISLTRADTPDIARRQIMVDPRSGVHLARLPRAATLGYFRSAEFEELLLAGRRNYDLVICDTPAVLQVPDALLVAKRADSVMIVVESNRSDASEISEISRRIRATSTPICGIVVTKLAADGAAFQTYSGYRHGSSGRREQRAISAG
jgi:Mrp family chromosome partitioning ATPase